MTTIPQRPDRVHIDRIHGEWVATHEDWRYLSGCGDTPEEAVRGLFVAIRLAKPLRRGL